MYIYTCMYAFANNIFNITCIVLTFILCVDRFYIYCLLYMHMGIYIIFT